MIGAEAATAPADWPQYRGPTRDGVAPVGPKLLDRWPKEGPPLLWKSAVLWDKYGGGKEGDLLPHAGCGSIVIAGGRAFLFANFKRDANKSGRVVLTTAELIDLGWMDGVPVDLAKKVEEERLHGKGAKMKAGPGLEEYARQYVGGLDPAAAKQFGPWIQRRLGKVPDSAKLNRLIEAESSTLNGDPIFEWSFLEKLAKVRDKEFPTVAAMDTELDGALNPWKSDSGNAIRVWLLNRTIHYVDAVICLDAATGKQIWRREWPGAVSPYAGAANVGASGTPTISGGKCYVAGSTAMYCLSVEDGKVIWQAKTEFTNSSPLVMNGTVYVSVPEPTAYDANTGHLLWRQPSLNNPNSSFTRWADHGKDYLIISFQGGVYDTPQGGVYLLDPADGKVLWNTFCPGSSVPVIVGADTLVMKSSHNFTTAFRITPARPEKLWETKKTGDTRGESPVIFEDCVYLAGACHSDNPLRCLDLKTGAVRWNPRKMDAAEASSPVLADGKIIALLENSENSLYVVMYRATPEKYEELGRFNPDAGPGASPVIVGGRLFLRLQDSVACYDLTGAGRQTALGIEAAAPLPPTAMPAATSGSSVTTDHKSAQSEGVPQAAVHGWRGDGTGVFAVGDPPTEWNESKNVKWTTPVGAGHSSPIVCAGNVFVTSEKCTLTCLDRRTGRVVWKKSSGVSDIPTEFQASFQENLDRSQLAGLSSCTPVCDGQSVFVVFGTGEVSRYDFAGNREWLRCIKPVGLNYGQSSSPLLADGKLVVYLDGLAALDARTGKTIWENRTIKRAHGSPVLMILGNTPLVITPTGFVVRLSDGKILDKQIADGLDGDEYSISPLVQDDVVYYIDSSCTAVKLTLDNEAIRKKTLWTAELPEAAIASPVFYNGLIFACTTTAHYSVMDATTGKPALVDLTTGKSIDDFILDLAPAGGNAKELTSANVYPSLSVAGHDLYISNDRGQTFVLDASKTYKEVRRNRLPQGSGASLFFDGPDMFIRGGETLYCVGSRARSLDAPGKRGG